MQDPPSTKAPPPEASASLFGDDEDDANPLGPSKQAAELYPYTKGLRHRLATENPQLSKPIVGVANQSISEDPTRALNPSPLDDDDDEDDVEDKFARVASSTSVSPKPPPKKLRTATTSRRVKLIETRHTTLTDKFKELRSATSKTSDDVWASFVLNVDAASSEIKAVIGLLDASQSPQQSAAPKAGNEDSNNVVFDEYTNFYDTIREALMESDGKIKSNVDKGYDALLQSIIPDDENSPKNMFAAAIKSKSLNGSAKSIETFESGENADINYNLLKVVLTQLSPNNIKETVKPKNPQDKFLTLDNLLGKIIESLNNLSSELWQKISDEYKTIATQAGGGSSSSLTTSKKNRKSHKSYHTSIGKTKKHHRGNHNKISFVH
jgi:hypothetical protein